MKVNLHEAKTHLSRLIRAALEGEEVIIAKAGVPMVKLVVLQEHRPTRRIGFAADLIEMSDDFDAPLDDFDGYR